MADEVLSLATSNQQSTAVGAETLSKEAQGLTQITANVSDIVKKFSL
ncbi:hypothetical protein [Enterovibrio sp. 27052020O]